MRRDNQGARPSAHASFHASAIAHTGIPRQSSFARMGFGRSGNLPRLTQSEPFPKREQTVRNALSKKDFDGGTHRYLAVYPELSLKTPATPFWPGLTNRRLSIRGMPTPVPKALRG